METKQETRKRIREFRKKITKEEKEQWDEMLCRRFLALLEETSVSGVYLYLDIRGEAGTRRILEALWERGIPTALPRVEGDRIYFYTVKGYDDVSPGCMGIPEPLEQCPRAEDPRALVIVPGVAFDARGGRLGYGGGYYDGFFAREPEHPRWGLAYGFQLAERLPVEEWDQKVDRVITPEIRNYGG